MRSAMRGPEAGGTGRLLAPTLVILLVVGTSLVVPARPVEASEPVMPGPPIVEGDGIEVDRFEADVDVVDALARTRLTIDLRNVDATDREATIDLPLPPTASLTGFNLTVDNRTYVGEVQESGQARRTYENATREGRDAVLLRQAGDDRVTMTVHVKPGQPRVLRLAYVEHLGLDRGDRVYRLPTSRLTLEGRTVDDVRIDVEATSRHGIENVTEVGLPFDDVDVSGDRLVATLRIDDVDDLGNVHLRWEEGGGAWLPSAIAADPPGTDAAKRSHLLVSLALRLQASEGVLPRDIVFVLDHSGSMGGSKIAQARASLDTVLPTIRPQDRFAVVGFDSRVDAVTEGLVQATPEAIERARAKLDTLEASGGTDLDGGLQQALELLGSEGSPERVPVVVLVTDGLPTVGVTGHERIVERLHDANARNASVHPIAIGLDADATFLQDVALTTGGRLVELDPGDDLEARLGDYYAELADPLATDLDVTVDGVPHGEVLPRVLPSLFRGDALALTMPADLSEGGNVTIHVEATTPQGRIARTFEIALDAARVDPVVHRLHGRARVDALLSDERMEGSSPGLRQAIVDNATRYGVVTPYTSWVVVEPRPAGDAGGSGSDGSVPEGAKAPGGPGDVVPLNGGSPAADRSWDSSSPPDPDRAADRPAVPAFEVLAVLVALGVAATVRAKDR